MTHNTPHLTTRIQLARALALAAAHGHGWSHVVYDDLQDNPELDTADMLKLSDLVGITTADCEKLIAEARTRQSPDWPGIEAPYFDCDGDIWHETQTGRLSWTVAQDGTTRVAVFRPQSIPVCSVGVAPDRKVSELGEQSSALLTRHMVALTKAIAAVTGRNCEDLQSNELHKSWTNSAQNQVSEFSTRMSELMTKTKELLDDIDFHRAFIGGLPDREEVQAYVAGGEYLRQLWMKIGPTVMKRFKEATNA
jgi:hypothetical protein